MTTDNIFLKAEAIKKAIHEFLDKRLSDKLEKETNDEKRRALEEKYRPENWIPDAARRVSQIQKVTHAIKYTHPDAKGTNLNSPHNPTIRETLIGTHTINGDNIVKDVTGAASALDVSKFLDLKIEGKTLLTYAIEEDPAFLALGDNNEKAQTWIIAFKSVINVRERPSSHILAKQVYWPMNDGNYHLLSPLFQTSLVHHLWKKIQGSKFSEETKVAREAKNNKKFHQHGYSEYQDIVIQKFGGTQPQNISLLNNERHGEIYLLASVPPIWKSEKISPPLKVESIFGYPFRNRQEVGRLLSDLKKFLIAVKNKNNLGIRNERAEFVTSILEELIQLAVEIQTLPSGWSDHPDCNLNQSEQYWLDPGRAQQDKFFSSRRKSTDWISDICNRFGNWLNAQLTDKIPMGDPEHHEWSDVLKEKLRTMRDELKLELEWDDD